MDHHLDYIFTFGVHFISCSSFALCVGGGLVTCGKAPFLQCAQAQAGHLALQYGGLIRLNLIVLRLVVSEII